MEEISVITRDRWQMAERLKHEAEADRIEQEHINPQLERATFYQRAEDKEVAMLRVHDVPREVVEILANRAKDAGWRTKMGPNDYFTLVLP